MTLTFLFFSILSILAIASAIVTIATKHPIKSAMALVVHFFMLSGLYLTLNAQFIAVLQILVYAGAIMVLVIFVIMLLNLGDEEKLKQTFQAKQYGAILLSVMFAILIIATFISTMNFRQFNPELSISAGTVEALGKELFSNFLFPIVAIGILLTTAIVGAIVLAKRKLD